MKFVIHPQHGVKTVSVIVWDAVANKELCTFVDGEFETEDETLIDKLLTLGYEYEGMLSEPEPEPSDPVEDEGTVNIGEGEEQALRAKAKALGIKSWHVKSVETLAAEIAEKEGN